MTTRTINDIAQEFNATGLTPQQSALLIELITAKTAQEKHLPTRALPDDWAPTQSHYKLALAKYGKSPAWVVNLAEDMRNWARSKGQKRASWNGTFNTFMQKAVEPRTNGGFAPAPSRPLGSNYVQRR